ncbi:CDP-glycerol glycerophosphotransferase family protein [Arthrobacter jiangjiafuii]|uniref:CDP-glycerol glycerophosphotransferase family protein n=1 Tax=Arthrobacter jiangjiafuii TaxID=2817475 RepID=A0A975M354_9MICC|nr:CDP-glycerol glycerophosphotransferase family protein [Arthrobacter jiangjiafuii]MBP3043604.1 CDP-glycerol glycerophosphotransferase family protein [Arthrobacter jiangjiafuii]QWC09113.1 CDP-glycerol glycerophosphotransferase family protein [Arthrobacter jiangjiafuii]
MDPVPAPEPDAAALRSWLDTVSTAAAVVEAEASDAEARHWYGQRLADLKKHVEYVQHSGPDQFNTLRQFVRAVLQGTTGQYALQNSLEVHQRVLLSLLAEGRRDDVLLVLADLQDYGASYPLEEAAGSACSATAVPPYLAQLSKPVDPSLLSLCAVDLPLSSRVTGFAWSDAGALEIQGWAYLPGIDPADCTLEVGLRHSGSSCVSALAVSRDQDPRIDIPAADRWQSYAGAAFTATVESRALSELQQDSGGASEWAVHVTLRAGDISVSDVIRTRDPDTLPRRLPVGPFTDDRTRIIGLMDGAQGLRLKAVRYSCTTAAVEVAGSVVLVRFERSAGPVPAALHLAVAGEPPVEFRPDLSGSVFSVDAAAVPGSLPAGTAEQRWTVKALLPNGRTEPLGWAGSSDTLAAASDPTAALRTECTGYGYLQVVLRPERVTLSNAAVSADGMSLVLDGRLGCLSDQPHAAPPELLLRTDRNDVRPLSAGWLDGHGSFRTVFPLTQDKWGLGESALESGHYRVLRTVTDENGRVRAVRVPALGSLLAELPLRALLELTSLELVGEGNEQDLVLRVSAPRTADERTARNRARLISDYSGSAEPMDRGSVLFETFDGKFCSDSGRAISDVLGLSHPRLHRYWTVADFSVPVPPDCTPVLRESREWFRLLATAGYLVNNNNFPHYFRKRPEQFYVQTWHGTPLKRIGSDTPVDGTTASYRALLQREAAAWDMLLSQSEFAAETLASAFGYRGEPAVFGYPRNDALTAETAAGRRLESRRRLGIADDRKVLLYLPTWRDNRSMADPYLDFEAAVARLGPEYVLLYRGHHKIAGRRKTTGQNHFIDVTTYPEINDLYLAADLLVTDYSSAMFDFCVTGKPMYFLVPDLARYRDSERGFYFGFEEEAPGPMVTSTDDLVAAILADHPSSGPNGGRYRQFTRRYAPMDDGSAAARAAKAVW